MIDRERFLVAVLLCAPFAAALAGTAQEAVQDESSWVVFETDSGLPSQRTYEVVETHAGETWVSTDGGICRFDGYEWHVPPGVHPSRRPEFLAPFAEGVVAVYNGELFRVDREGSQKIELEVRIAQAGTAWDGSLLLLADSPAGQEPRCFRLTDRLLGCPLPEDPGMAGSASLVTLGDGTVGLRLGTRFFDLVDGQFVPILPEVPVGGMSQVARRGAYRMGFANRQAIASFLEEWHDGVRSRPEPLTMATIWRALSISPAGDALLINTVGQVYLRHRGTWHPLQHPPWFLRNANDLLYRENGDLWVTTALGIYLYRSHLGRWEYWQHGDDPFSNRVLSLLETRSGDIWIGTGDGIEVRSPQGEIRRFREVDGVELLNVTGLEEDDDGNVWCSSGNSFQGAYCFDGQVFRHHGPGEGLTAPRVHRIERAPDGDLWFFGLGEPTDPAGSKDPGIFVRSGGRFENWTDQQEITPRRFYDVVHVSRDELWLAGLSGIWRRKQGEWTTWNRSHGLRMQHVPVIAQGPGGRLWFAHQTSGLGYIDAKDQVQYVQTTQGLLSHHVSDLKVDAGGRLWAATAGGLCVYDSEAWTGYSQRFGLRDSSLFCLLPAKDRIFIGSLGRGTWVLHFQPSGSAAPHAPAAPESLPVVRFDRAFAEGQTLLLRWRALAPWGDQPPSEVLTRYRLDGGEWSAWNSLRSFERQGLSYGPHLFEVQARDLFGRPTEILQQQVPIPRPIQHRLLFRVGAALLGATIVVLAGLLVVRRRRHRRDIQRSREAAEFACRRSEERFRHMTDALPVLMIYADRYERILYHNERLQELFGENIRGRRMEEVLGEGNYAVIAAQVQQALAGEEVTFDAPWCIFDGQIVHLQIHCVPLLGLGGEVEGIYALTSDITDLKQAEVQQVQRAIRLQEYLDQAGIGIGVCNRAMELQYVNASLALSLGYHPRDLTRRSMLELTHPEDRERAEEVYARFVQRGDPRVQLEHRLRHRDDRDVWVSLTLTWSSADQDSWLVAVVLDITPRKRAEAALNMTRERHQTLFDSSRDGLAYLDLEGHLLEANTAFCDLLGFTPEEIREVCLENQLSEAWRPWYREVLGAQVNQRGYSDEFEVEMLRKDGSQIPTSLRAWSLMDDARRSSGIGCVLRDISERAEREKLREQLRQSQKMEALGQLAGGVAHDFNNLLSVVLGNSDLLRQQLYDSPERGSTRWRETVENLDQVLDAGQRAATLTRQLLAFSRRQVLRTQLLNCNAVIRDLQPLVRRLLAADTELVMHLAADLRTIRADRTQLEQVVLNLLVNARDALEGGGTVRLSTRNIRLDESLPTHDLSAPAGDYVEIRVEDDGCGMDVATMRRAFEPFFTTKPLGKGTGLGLATVFGIVSQAKGFVVLDSEEGRGTCFRILLPPAANPDETSAPAASGGCILVCEDEDLVRRSTCQVLARAGYQVIESASANEAIARLSQKESRVDLLITDVVMPDRGGLQLAREAGRLRPDLKVLFVSGYSSDVLSLRGLDTSREEFLSKPFLPTTLLQSIDRLLRRSAPAASPKRPTPEATGS